MTAPDSSPWWTYTKDEQKRQIEEAVEWYLSESGELSNRHKLLLNEAIGHAYNGFFGWAAQNIYDLGLPESAWACRVEPLMVEGITHDLLRRKLDALRTSAVQERPVLG